MSAVGTGGTLVTAIRGAKGAEAVAARTAVAAAGDEGAAVLLEVSDRKLLPATVVATVPAKQLEAAIAAFDDDLTVRVRGRLCFVSIPDTDDAAERVESLIEVLPAGVPWVVCAPASRYRQILETIPVESVMLRVDRSEEDGTPALLGLAELEARTVAGGVEVVEESPGRLAARRFLAGSAARVRARRPGTRQRLLQERGQATPLVLGAVFVLVLGTVVLVMIAGAITGKARAQSVADLSALSAARSMKRDLPRLLAPPTLPNGLPNPAHMSKFEYLARARLTATRIAVSNGSSPLRISVRFPDSLTFAPVRARVSVRTRVESGGPGKWTSDWAEARVGAPVSMGAVPAVASGGGYSGPLAQRQGHGMRPDVAAAFDAMVAAASRTGVVLTVNSAFRSDAEQAALFAAHPDPTWVARPGTSLHRCATELDLGASDGYGWLVANAGRFGFVQRYSWEAWHFGYTAGPAPCSEAGNAVGAAGGRGDPSQTPTRSLPSFVPARFRKPILASAMKWNVSAALLAAQLYAESGFDPTARSPVGAQGIAQFMPATAASYGLDNPFDPAAAIDAQGHLMSDLLKQFGSPSLALAAYNAGPGAVAPCKCIPPYAETQAYVAKILALLGGISAIAPMPMDVELVK
ncbi:MAG: transglycosylase SLT domain-containing protein [Solirubrobacterales bacterium]|nr:transglycosylase SLT domain-containing protein [Solirubrobacterales bacterium]